MDQKNMFLAIAISLAILFGWQFLYEGPRREAQQAEQARQAELTQQAAPGGQTAPGPASAPLPSAIGAVGTAGAITSRTDAIAASRRIPLQSPSLSGSINLENGRIDDVVLRNFRETVEPNSDNIMLLSPTGSPNPYFAEFGWSGPQGALGGGGTNWQAQGSALTPNSPLVLTAQTEQGLTLTRTYSIDDKFMFTVVDRVENNGDAPVNLSAFSRLTRINEPDTLGFFILHEGPIGILDGTLREIDYDDLRDESQPTTIQSTGGWLGITDKYWLAAVIPDQAVPVNTSFSHALTANRADSFQTDYIERNARTVPPGGSIEATSRLFAGAKVFETLVDYRDNLNLPRFELAMDFGWFFFITKPLLQILIAMAEQLSSLGITASFGVAILLVTVVIKLIFFPLANKSYKSMSKMKALQPKMTEIREKFGDDKQKMQQELMAMYKRERVNPVSGCLPIALQIPVFFALYKVLFISIEMRQQPFYGWIEDLSERDPTNIFDLFGLIPWDLPVFLAVPSIVAIGAWPLLMGGSMFLQQKLNPAPADPVQARMFMLMPLIFMFFLANFPVGLVIYWTWNNLLSIAQQYVIMRRMGVAIGGGTVGGGAKTT